MIPLNISLPSLRTKLYDHVGNVAVLRANLDLLEEVREQDLVHMTNYQQRMAWYYNFKVKHKLFKVGNLVLRQVEASQPTKVHKLSSKWEGPYQVSKVVRPGAY